MAVLCGSVRWHQQLVQAAERTCAPCAGADAYVLCGNPSATRELFLKVKQKYPIVVGGIDVRLLHYQVRGHAQTKQLDDVQHCKINEPSWVSAQSFSSRSPASRLLIET
jgi:hypothetical protein